jgi:hypothetical protein
LAEKISPGCVHFTGQYLALSTISTLRFFVYIYSVGMQQLNHRDNKSLFYLSIQNTNTHCSTIQG